MRAGGIVRAAVLIGAVVGVILSRGAAAQQTAEDRAAIEAAYEAAFQATLNDPADLDTTFEYAELAVKVGDVEGAISALERMLIYNPDLPRVRLELGVLYFRLGSYEIARSYLTRAVEGADVPEPVRARVAVYLDEIDDRLSRHKFTGSVLGGYRYQSNANAGPSSPAVRVFGLPATLADRFTQKADSNGFLSASLRHLYDFRTQGGEVWESNGLAYGSRQREQEQLDLGVLELNTGPAGQVDAGPLGRIGYRPYLVGSVVTLEDRRYLTTWGAGLTLKKAFTKRVLVDLNYEHRERTFKNSGTRPAAEAQSGSEDGATVGVTVLVMPTLNLRVVGKVEWERASRPALGSREESIAATVSKSYRVPALVPGRWTSSFSVLVSHRKFNEIDIIIDPGNKRIDRERRFQFVQTVPLWRSFSLVGTAQRTLVDSSLPNFSYTNTALTIGLSFRF